MSIRRIDPNYKPVGRITSENSSSIEEKHYCESCKSIGVVSVMGPRVNYNEEDKDLWKQCYSCGRVVAVHELKIEGKLEDVTTTYDNPFAFGNKIVLGVGQSRKFDSKTGTSEYLKKRKLKEQFSDIKDEDLKRELRKGAKLISYNETL